MLYGFYEINNLKKSAEVFVECYLRSHPCKSPTDWECFLMVQRECTVLYVVIFSDARGIILESRYFPL